MSAMKIGYRNKLAISYSLLLVIVIVVLINVAYRYILDVSERTAAVSQHQLLDKTLTQIESYLNEMDQMALQVSRDSRIINQFSILIYDTDMENHFDQNIMDNIDMASVLATHNGPRAAAWRISLYNQYGDFISTGASVSPQSQVDHNIRLNNRVEQLIEGTKVRGFMIFPPEIDRWSGIYTSKVTSFVRPIYDYYEREAYGIVEIQQEIENLESLIALNVQSNIKIFVFSNRDGQVLPQEISFEDYNNDQNYITTAVSEKYGWSVSLVQSKEALTAPYRSVILYLYLGGIGILVFLIFIVYLLARRLSAPILELSDKVKRITLESRPQDLAMDTSQTDEIRELNANFSAMLKRLNDSIAYEKRSYLLALQAQMDPHFLFNALSNISALSLSGRPDDTAEACDKLGSMLRYSASYDTQAIVLQDELENVQNYLDLMKLRFQTQFDYTVEVDNSLRNLPMPRLILQPIVENCFAHGFRDVMPPWNIKVQAKRENGSWVISVADNGGGFSQEKITEMERKIQRYSENLPHNYPELKIGGIGLVNTIIRLQLAAGGKITHSMKRNHPTGTIVMLRGELGDAHSDS